MEILLYYSLLWQLFFVGLTIDYQCILAAEWTWCGFLSYEQNHVALLLSFYCGTHLQVGSLILKATFKSIIFLMGWVLLKWVNKSEHQNIGVNETQETKSYGNINLESCANVENNLKVWNWPRIFTERIFMWIIWMFRG